MCLATSNNSLLVLQDDPKRIFLTNSRSSGQPKNDAKTLFFHPPSPFPVKKIQLQQWWHLYCFAILRSTSIVTHSLKQHVLRNRPESDAATPCDFLHERLQRANSCKPATLNCPTKPTRGDSLFYCSFHTTAGQWIR